MKSEKDIAVTISGEIHRIGEVQEFSSGFRKRTLVLVQGKGTKWPNYIPFTFAKDKCDLLNGCKVGESVSVGGFLNGREWQKSPQDEPRCFLDINGMEIVRAGGAANPQAEPEPTQPDAPEEYVADDLPF